VHQPVHVSDAVDVLNREASPAEDATQLQVGVRARDGMNEPLDLGHASAPSVGIRKAPQATKNTFAPAIDVRELDDEARRLEPSPPQNAGTPDREHDGIFREQQNVQLGAGKLQKLPRREPLDEHA
jgi:hypothetical protein